MAHPHQTETAPGHESTDVTLRPIVVVGGVGIAVMLAFIAAMWVLIDFSAERQAVESPPVNPLAAQFARKEPPMPRLQAHPLDDLRSLRAREDATLDGYGWVNRQTGAVRIPIDRAKELLVQRGLPGRDE